VNFWVLTLLNGLTFSMVLFLMAAGLTLIFGLQNILNLAHGSFYILGAYIVIEIVGWHGPYVLGIFAAMVVVGVLGILVYRFLLQRLGQNHLAQVLLTIGIVFIVEDIALAVWGGNVEVIPAPAPFNGVLTVGSVSYPTYWLLVIVVGLITAGCLALIQDHTRLGAMVRAGVDDPEMAQGMGIPLTVISTAVFGGGAALAALGGALAVPITGVGVGTDFQVLLFALVVIVIGGFGSLGGAFIASILIGVLDSVGRAEFPALDLFAVFLPMVIILAVRPTGLLGRK
jgi:branched-chain amino acid transport system permease protein